MKLICYTDREFPGMTCTLNHEMIIFLDKRDSSLISRQRKNSSWYKFLAEEGFENRENWDKNLTYVTCNGDVYNIVKDYFVRDESDRLDDIEWRTHSDLIDFVRETDQKDYELVDISDNMRCWSEIEINHGNFILIMCDNNGKFMEVF